MGRKAAVLLQVIGDCRSEAVIAKQDIATPKNKNGFVEEILQHMFSGKAAFGGNRSALPP
jgi:hypothetical protein